MTHTPRTVYFAMAAYLIVGGTIRCVLQVTGGQRVDWLPVIAITLGVAALVLAFRPHRPTRGPTGHN